MNGRINWIDWTKALAVCTVVLCHMPQSQEWFYYRYLQACVITLFFFISGYLKHDRDGFSPNVRYYVKSLVLPYLLYNALVYPWWLVRFYAANGTLPDAFQALKPILGALLLQHENAFSEPLDGPLWYVPAVLLMHLCVDLARRTRHLHAVMLVLCGLSFCLYAANKYWAFLPNLTPMGVFREFPYYYIGYVLGRQQCFATLNRRRDGWCCAGLFAASWLLFYWHLHEEVFLLHIALFYPVNLCFLFGTLYGCKWLDKYHHPAVINLSIGSLVVIGLHVPLISIANVLFAHLTHTTAPPCYEWYEAVPVSLLVVALLYPVIRLSLRHYPMLIGGRKR